MKDGSEGLIIHDENEKKYKFLDPFLPSDAIDITNIIDNHENIVITKSNRKLSIIENIVHVTNGLNENSFQQMLNKTTYHSNIHTYPIFKAIRDMLKDIEELPEEPNEACDFPEDNKDELRNYKACDFPEDNRDELANGELFRFILEKRDDDYVDIKGLKKSQNNE